jgi:hypothetical protein
MTIVGKIEFEPKSYGFKVNVPDKILKGFRDYEEELEKLSTPKKVVFGNWQEKDIKKKKYKCFGCSRQCSLKMFHNMPSLCVLNSNNKAIWNECV